MIFLISLWRRNLHSFRYMHCTVRMVKHYPCGCGARQDTSLQACSLRLVFPNALCPMSVLHAVSYSPDVLKIKTEIKKQPLSHLISACKNHFIWTIKRNTGSGASCIATCKNNDFPNNSKAYWVYFKWKSRGLNEKNRTECKKKNWKIIIFASVCSNHKDIQYRDIACRARCGGQQLLLEKWLVKKTWLGIRTVDA